MHFCHVLLVFSPFKNCLSDTVKYVTLNKVLHLILNTGLQHRQNTHLLCFCPHQLWGPFSLLSSTGGPFPGGKAQPGHDTDHSPLSSTELKNE
jgi:hypothetical protein